MARRSKKFLWVTVALAACAVGAGLGFSFFVQALLPSHKNTVITVSDVPEINQLLYVEDTQKLMIFPWDQFDASEGLSIDHYSEYWTEIRGEGSPPWQEAFWEDMQARLESLLEVHEVSLEKWPDLLSYTKVDTSKQWVYLKEVPVRTDDGQDCLLDAAWRGMGDCTYFHVYKKETEVLPDSTVESANRYLDSVFQKNWHNPDYIVNYNMPNQIGEAGSERAPEDADPITEWMAGLHDLSYVESLLRQRCERIVYHDEILLVYSKDQTHRVVLFYDPVRNHITGFSINL